jgi:hypothetical protein
VNRQNRMNAGAEYVLCRLWATLQGREGVHPESLLACLGALAGYACQVNASARPTGDLSSPRTGPLHFAGSVPNPSLAGTPVSVCSLVGRTVQKLGKPQPDVDEILRHVTETLGTSGFGVPRVPPEHRPRHSPVVYLKQIWPQILPIAQPFCRRPAQLPVLFGIAIQRAIELTQGTLNPTLGATIAMESAVAMSKVVLPKFSAEPEPALASALAPTSATIAPELNAAPTALPLVEASASGALVRDTPPSRRKKKAVDVSDASGYNAWHLVERLAPARNAVTIAALAIVAMAGTMWGTDRPDVPKPVRELRRLESGALDARTLAARALDNAATPTSEAPFPESPPAAEMLASQNDPLLPEQTETEAPSPIPEQPANEGIIADDVQSSYEPSVGGQMSGAAMAVDS